MSTYQLIDEPRPSSAARLTVDPMWPLLGYMLGSPFFAWVWFALNSHAMGSPTKIKEYILIGAGVVGFFVLNLAIGGMLTAGVIGEAQVPYLKLAVNILTLTITYILYVYQNRPFEIYRHFDGNVMSGMPGLILGIIFGAKLQNFIIDIVLGVLLP